jgi:hypothetical protein
MSHCPRITELLMLVVDISTADLRSPAMQDEVRQEVLQALRDCIDTVTLFRTTRASYRPKGYRLELYHDDKVILSVRTKEHCKAWLAKLAGRNIPVVIQPFTNKRD